MSNTVVNTNVLALTSHRALKGVGGKQAQASARLSTGQKINSAADDAAGLAISEKMRAQIRGLDMASKNSQDGISLLQTADGGMQEIDNMVQRVRELAVQAANETNVTKIDVDGASQRDISSNAAVASSGHAKSTLGTADTKKLAAEASQLILEIDSMTSRVEFNKKNLLGNKLSVHLQVGANTSQKLVIKINSMNASSLGLTKTSTGTTPGVAAGQKSSSVVGKIYKGGSSASKALRAIDQALNLVTVERAKLGAYQNRLEYTIKSLDVSSENLTASESRIRDTDMAKEMMNMTKANVLQQAATSMLSQANQAPQNVLQLLR